jgi:PncC family amidohydrolase
MPEPKFRKSRTLAEELVGILDARGKMIVIAESCTAGRVADLIACVPGASKALWGSFVCYTADAKSRMLGVPEELIRQHGAVSRAVALSMAEGALERSGAWHAVSVTGLAGPTGEGSPIGTVWIGLAGKGCENNAKKNLFSGSRDEVREAAAAWALHELLQRILTLNDFCFSI